MKLLIVDDNAEVRRLIKNIFDKYFEELIECSDGGEAVSLYGIHKPDWVLMDIKMDKMDGLTATKKIIHDYPEAKIIIVSQYNDDIVLAEAMKTGAAGFVNKEDLSKIEEVIKKSI